MPSQRYALPRLEGVCPNALNGSWTSRSAGIFEGRQIWEVHFWDIFNLYMFMYVYKYIYIYIYLYIYMYTQTPKVQVVWKKIYICVCLWADLHKYLHKCLARHGAVCMVHAALYFVLVLRQYGACICYMYYTRGGSPLDSLVAWVGLL
jgi:hypothetical protein